MSRRRLSFVSRAAAREAGGAHASALQAFRLLSVVGTQLKRLADSRFRGEAITTRQATLITIAKEMGTPSISEVAAVMSTSHQNIKQIALALERRGFLRIVQDAHDSRVRRLIVTAKNDRFWANRDADDAAAIAGWFSVLSDAELRRLNTTLQTLAERFEDPSLESGSH
ncbi:MAG: MarR family winged helix-turn-helix transcriptional regulator [Vicinamibacterales bacterium]